MNTVSEAIQSMLHAVALKHPMDQVPVVVWGSSPFMSHFYGLTYKEYFSSPVKMLNAQIFTIKRFPNAHLYGIFPDFGLVTEPSAFGCKVEFPEDGPPWIVKFALETIEDVEKVEAVNPFSEGLVTKALDVYDYMIKRLRKELPDYPLDFTGGVIRGPFTVATLVRGYDAFIKDVYTEPELAHKLLRKITDFLIAFYKAQEECSGKLSRIIVCDDNASWLSPKLASEFSFKYVQELFSKYRKICRLYHNDGYATHLLDLIKKCGANAFNFGKVVELEVVRHKLGGKMALLGNIDPVEVLLRGTPSDVEQASNDCLDLAGSTPGFILCSGGVLAPNTPVENIDAMVRSAATWNPSD